MATILCTGDEPLLLETRKLILQKKGHTVVSAQDQSSVLAICQQHSIDVAVIGECGRPERKREIAAIIRRHFPAVKILELHGIYQSKIIKDPDSTLAMPPEMPDLLARYVDELLISKLLPPHNNDQTKSLEK
jgi:CheY-like chemotaxis protein